MKGLNYNDNPLSLSEVLLRHVIYHLCLFFEVINTDEDKCILIVKTNICLQMFTENSKGRNYKTQSDVAKPSLCKV